MILAEFTDEYKNLQVDSLYQWDLNQTLKISGINFGGIAVKVHFCNKKSDKALVVESTEPSGGAVSAVIPNSLLQEPFDIIAYIYQSSGTTANTIKSIRIPVIARPKPNDYNEPSGDTIIEIHEIELAAQAIIDGLTASEYSPTAAYKCPNIVYYDTSSYFCLSGEPITGIPPTNTEYWQKLCNGLNVTSITLTDNSNLTFTFDDGTTKTVVIDKIEATLTDTVPYANALVTGEIEQIVEGLYAVTVEVSGSHGYSEYVTVMLSIPNVTIDTVGIGYSSQGASIVTVKYNATDGEVTCTGVDGGSVSILEVRLITTYFLITG